MRILFVNSNIGYGGASKIMASLANYLSDLNHEVVFLTYSDPNDLQYLNPRVVRYHDALCTSKIKVIKRIGQILALKRFIKDNEFDIAISFLQPSSYMLVLASKWTKTKVIISERGDPFVRGKQKGLAKIGFKLMDWVTQLADGLVFQTVGAQDYYSKADNRQIVIPNPVANSKMLDEYRYSGKREKAIVNVARLDVAQKRQDVLLQAFSIISRNHEEYVLKLYGDGPDKDELVEMAGQLGIQDKVYFMGYVRNVYKEITKASLFVLSSDFEGIPNALIEAMSLGMPCVSTDCSPGGARLLIKSGKNGLLVPPGEPTSLANAIDYMLSNPKEAYRMGQNALEITDEFLEDKIYKKWERFINDVSSGP